MTPPPKYNAKYNAAKVECDGYTFDSKAEGRRYQLLKNATHIENLNVHPSYVLQEGFESNEEKIRAINYIADFAYFDTNEKCYVVEDVKGIATQEALLKRKMFLKKYCLNPKYLFRTELLWVSEAPKWTGQDWIDYFELQKLRRKRKKASSPLQSMITKPLKVLSKGL
jgi:hypothetical protein